MVVDKAELSNLNIFSCGLSVRAVNVLTEAGYVSLIDCLDLKEKQLLKFRNLGRKTADEILALIDKVKHEYNSKDTSQNATEESLSVEKTEYLIKVLSVPIKSLPLTIRAQNVLWSIHAITLRDLVVRQPSAMLRAKNCGRKTVAEIDQLLTQLDLGFAMRISDRLRADIAQYSVKNGNRNGFLLSKFTSEFPDKLQVLAELKKNTLAGQRSPHYERCSELYKQKGTLQKVADELGLTRQRVQQMLKHGVQLGAFEYKPKREYPYISKNKILSEYSKYLDWEKVAKKNAVPTSYVTKLRTAYSVTPEKISELRTTYHKRRCIEKYDKIKSKLGCDPSTTVLQAKGPWRYLEARIRRLWGSFHEFRREFNIPSPPSFTEATRPWIEHQSRVAFIRRMQDLDDVRDCLCEHGPLRTGMIAAKTRLRINRVLKLLKMLVATGEVVCEGAKTKVLYRLLKKKEKTCM